MSLTENYGRLHRAMREVSAAHGLMVIDARVLLALYERDGSSNTSVLANDLWLTTGTQIRRSLLDLRPRYATGGNRRGTRLPITLTAEGRAVAMQIVARHRWLGFEERSAAA